MKNEFLPSDILQWCPYDTYEATEEGIITDDQIDEETDLIYSHDHDGTTYCIQRIFNRSARVYQFLAVYNGSFTCGWFRECVAFLNEKINS